MKQTITIVALVIALATGFFVWNGIQNTSTQVFVPALQYNIAPGTKITADMFVPNGVPLDEKALNDLPIVTDVNQILGKVAIAHIFANVPIIQQQLIDEELSVWEESKNNHFVSVPLQKIGLKEVPYSFMHGKIDICITISQSKALQAFSKGIPAEEYQKFILTDSFCPVKNIYSIALTEENLLPWTYVTFDPTAQKYIAGPQAAKLGFWLSTRDDILLLERVFQDIASGIENGYVSTFIVLPPTNDTESYSSEEETIIDLSKQIINPYDYFGIPWTPEDIANNESVIQKETSGEDLVILTPYPENATPEGETENEPFNPFQLIP